MRLSLALYTLLLAIVPAEAQIENAVREHVECVTAAASRFAELEQPISEIVAIGIASCKPTREAVRQQLATVNMPKRQPTLDAADALARERAVLAVAEVKLDLLN